MSLKILIFHTRSNFSCAIQMIEWWQINILKFEYVLHEHIWAQMERKKKNSHCCCGYEWELHNSYFSQRNNEKEERNFHCWKILESSHGFIISYFCQPSTLKSVRMSSVLLDSIVPLLSSSYVSCFEDFALLLVIMYSRRKIVVSSLISRAVISDANMSWAESSHSARSVISQSSFIFRLPFIPLMIITKVYAFLWKLTRENENLNSNRNKFSLLSPLWLLSSTSSSSYFVPRVSFHSDSLLIIVCW